MWRRAAHRLHDTNGLDSFHSGVWQHDNSFRFLVSNCWVSCRHRHEAAYRYGVSAQHLPVASFSTQFKMIGLTMEAGGNRHWLDWTGKPKTLANAHLRRRQNKKKKKSK